MRILFISNYYPPFEFGGYEQLCRDVADRLAKRGHEIAVLTSNNRIRDRGTSNDENVFRTLRIGPSRTMPAATPIEFFTYRRAKTRRNLECLEDALTTFRPDVVFIWNLQGLPMEIAKTCEERADITVAYWLAGYSPAEPDGYWRYWVHVPARRTMALLKGPLRRLACKMMVAEGKPIRPQMKHAGVVSHYMQMKGLADGTLPATTEVIYNGVEFERFYRPVSPRAGQPLRLLQAGRVSRDKGVHTSIRALAHLVEEGKASGLQLMIAGSGPADYEREMRQLVRDYQLADEVRFSGWLPRDKMPEVMGKAHVLLLPTEHPEPFARVMLEGMAAGLAVVASDTGGTGELLRDEDNGLLFEAGDGHGLAHRVAMLLSDDALRQRLASAGQNHVQDAFTMEVMVTKIERFLREALVKECAHDESIAGRM